MKHEHKINYNTKINIVSLGKKKFYNKFLKLNFSKNLAKQNINKIYYNSNVSAEQILIDDRYYIECNFNIIKNFVKKKNFLRIYYKNNVVAVYLKKKVEKDKIKKLFKSNVIFGKKNKFKIFCIDLSKNKTKKKTFKTISEKQRALFIDRDGTINKDSGYTHKFNSKQIFKTTLSYMKKYSLNNNIIIIVTNQAGIAKKKFLLSDFEKYMDKLKNFLLKNNVTINKIYFCPHHEEGFGKFKKNCNYRKPGIGMIKKGINYFKLSKKNCEYLGNNDIDKLCAYKSKIIYKHVNEI